MGFTNLYKKSTANPKEIDFARIGATAKNRIPDAAIKAFQQKVPGPQAKPFDFAFDYDAAARKLQITVKKAGADFVYGWADPVLLENQQKMKGVEADIAGWKTKMEEAVQEVGKLHGGAGQIAKWAESLEQTAAQGGADAGSQKEVEAIDAALAKLENEKLALHTKAGQFWNGGPNGGVVALLKKHGISEQIVQERQQADTDYRALQQTLARFHDGIRAVEQEIAAIRKHSKDASVKLAVSSVNLNADRQGEKDDAAVEMQKTVGEIQGYANADFEEVKAKELTRAAKEFADKSGTAWEKLSANAGEIDKTIALLREVGLKMRVRSGRVEERYQVWQKPIYQERKALEKYQAMLKMVRDEYMQGYDSLQKTLQSYAENLTKQKPKAVELAAKAAKAKAKIAGKK